MVLQIPRPEYFQHSHRFGLSMQQVVLEVSRLFEVPICIIRKLLFSCVIIVTASRRLHLKKNCCTTYVTKYIEANLTHLVVFPQPAFKKLSKVGSQIHV